MSEPGAARPRVLVVDDDANVVSWLVEALYDEGFEAEGEISAPRALARLLKRPYEVVVSDVEMPTLRGLDLLRAVHAQRPEQPIVLITAFGSIDLAVEAVRAGAADFLAKPFRIEALTTALRRVLSETARHQSTHRPTPREGLQRPLIAESPAMQRALTFARRAARSHLPVLLTGESGVGKGALARFVHQHSARAGGPFIQTNCATLPEKLAEAELFGVRKGAFTDAHEDRPGLFEQAHNGTLFLDELAELSLEVQPKLLQALETGQVRPLGARAEVPAEPRLIAATNQALEEAIRERRFRPDLYHRLNVLHIEVPPLRARPEDIPPLVAQALARARQLTARPHLHVSAEGLQALCAWSWPGNVRELLNALDRAAALSDHDELGPEDFSLSGAPSAGLRLDTAAHADWSLAEVEKAYIREVLAKTGGHKSEAARILGLDRRTLYRKAAQLDRAPEGGEEPPPKKG